MLGRTKSIRRRASVVLAAGAVVASIGVSPVQANQIHGGHSEANQPGGVVAIAQNAASQIDQRDGFWAAAPVANVVASAGTLEVEFVPVDEVAIGAVSDAQVTLTTSDVDITIGLPYSTGEAAVSIDGTDVIPSVEGIDNVVERHSTGVRAMTVIHDETAPTMYPYTLTGGVFVQEHDGTVVIEDGEGRLIGEVAPAWAIDAEGLDVPTWYEVSGNELRQYVDHRSAAYPVVADPSVRVTWNKFWITYNRSEVRALRGMARTMEFYGAVCAPISALGPIGWFGTAICAQILGAVGESFYNTWMNAANSNRCMEVGMLHAPFPPAVTDWRPVDC